MLCKTATASRTLTNKRDIILDAAAKLFLKEGYGAASINKLITHIGGSKATVYAYFENKERLFAAVVESIVDEVPVFINDVQLEGVEMRDGLIAISERLLEIATSPRHLALARLVIAEAEKFPEIGRIYYERASRHICEVLTAFVKEETAKDGIKIIRPQEMVESFTGMVLHHQLFRQFCLDASPPSSAEIRRLAVRNANLLIAMINTAPAGSRP
jgi:AcrR family transcriptional regulator